MCDFCSKAIKDEAKPCCHVALEVLLLLVSIRDYYRYSGKDLIKNHQVKPSFTLILRYYLSFYQRLPIYPSEISFDIRFEVVALLRRQFCDNCFLCHALFLFYLLF